MKKIVLMLSLLVMAVPPAFSQMNHEPMKDCEHCDMHNPQMGGMVGMGGMDRMGEMMGMCIANAEKIGLTPDQIKKITPIHRELQKKHVRFKADMKIAEMELMEIMEVRDFDLDKAGAAVKKIADTKTAHHLDVLKSMKAVRVVLTDEQFKKMQKLMPAKVGGVIPEKKVKHRH